MSKKVFVFTAAAIALTACTATDLIDENLNSGSMIGFNSNVSHTTRALSNDNFSKFMVYGGYTPKDLTDYHTVFSGVTVSKEADGTWTYEGSSKYWVPEATYTFYAYSCENLKLSQGTPELSTSGAEIGTFKITEFVCNDGHQHDLIYAATNPITAKETGNAKVSLSFKHILTKVNAVFKSGFDSDYTIDISEVEFHNIYDKADFSSATNLWNNQARTIEYDASASQWTKVTLPIDGTDKTIQAAKPGSEGVEAVPAKELTTSTGFFLPVTYSSNNVTLSFKIVVKQDGNTIKTDYVKGNIKPEWAIGTSYTYNVTVNGSAAGVEKIEFEVDATNGIENWTEKPNVDFNVGG